MIFWSTSVNVGRVRGERAGGGRRGGQEGGGGVGSMGGEEGCAVWGGGVAGGGYLGTIRMLPVALCELRMFLL